MSWKFLQKVLNWTAYNVICIQLEVSDDSTSHPAYVIFNAVIGACQALIKAGWSSCPQLASYHPSHSLAWLGFQVQQFQASGILSCLKQS
jgi:hypothetical protein